MVNIKMSQTNKMPPQNENDELDCMAMGSLQVTPLKSSGQFASKGGLLIQEEKHGLCCHSLSKLKTHSPSSICREATTQRSLTIQKSSK